MRKSLWLSSVLSLLAAIGVPSAQADFLPPIQVGTVTVTSGTCPDQAPYICGTASVTNNAPDDEVMVLTGYLDNTVEIENSTPQYIAAGTTLSGFLDWSNTPGVPFVYSIYGYLETDTDEGNLGLITPTWSDDFNGTVAIDIPAAEPSSTTLTLVGLGLLALTIVIRKRFAHRGLRAG